MASRQGVAGPDLAASAVEGPSAQGSSNEEVAETHPRRGRDRPDLGSSMVRRGHDHAAGASAGTGSTGADVPYPLGFGAFGFVAGVTFSGVLGLVEGRRRFDQMALPRFAGWGAAGGFLLSAIFVLAVALAEDPAFLWNLVVLGPIFAVAGAGSAAGSLALARRAEDREFLEASEDVAECARDLLRDR